MFNLTESDCRRRILGCGDGPASFNAEMTAEGFTVVSIDPLYAWTGTEIQAQFNATAEQVISQVRATPQSWTWSFHRDPEDLRSNRRKVMARFAADYEIARGTDRYRVAALPSLPFSEEAFDLALCSHLLFLYSGLLSEKFHVESVRELCRVAQEVRIFPLLTLAGERSPHLPAVLQSVDALGIRSEVVPVNYELQQGGNEMLRVFRD